MVLLNETLENILLVVFGVLVGGFLVVSQTSYDAQFNYFANDPVDYVTPPEGDVELTIQKEDVDYLNRISKRSLGIQPVAEERMLCFQVRNATIHKLHLVDKINISQIDKISGTCVYPKANPVDGIIHTHPDHSSELSREDKNLEGIGLDFTCIQYGHILEGFQGEIRGLRCWKISEEEPRFEEITLDIVQRRSG